jgi:hypothetical protein
VTTTSIVAERLEGDEARLASILVRWIETGERPPDLFTHDVFADLSLPQWRLQGEGPAQAFALRAASHPHPGQVTVSDLDRTSRGFLVELQERWEADGQRWYCRELVHCHISDNRVSGLGIYCTGDWDEATQRRHAEQVRLVRS